MVFDMLKYTSSDSLFNTLYINIKYKRYKLFLRAKQTFVKIHFFSGGFNSSQFYFQFVILI